MRRHHIFLAALLVGSLLAAMVASAPAVPTAKKKKCGRSGYVSKLVVRKPPFTCAKGFRWAKSVPERKVYKKFPQSNFRHRRRACIASLQPPQNPGPDAYVECYRKKVDLRKKPLIRWAETNRGEPAP